MSPQQPTPLEHLPTTWQEILKYLKQHGEARAEAIAAALSMTPSGVRQHLTVLARDGLVRHREWRDGPGRPKHLYALTPAADAFFPRAYAELVNELLDYVGDADPALVAKLFERRGDRRLCRTLERTRGLGFRERVAEIAAILDEDGYLAEFEARPDGSFLLTEHNCAVLGVAQRFGHACTSELQYLQAAMPDAEVRRVSHIIAGAHACAYEVRPRA